MIPIIVFFSKHIYYKPYRINTGYSIISPIIYAKKLLYIMSIIFILFYMENTIKKRLFLYNKFNINYYNFNYYELLHKLNIIVI